MTEEKKEGIIVSILDDMHKSILDRIYWKDGDKYLLYEFPEKPGQPYKLAKISNNREVYEVSLEDLVNYKRVRSNLEEY